MHLAVSLVCFVVNVPPFGTPRSLFISISPPFDPYISIVPPHHRSLLTLRFSMHLHPATFCCSCVSLSHNYRPLSLHSSYSSPLPSASHTYFCSTFSFVCPVSLRRFAPDVLSIRYTRTVCRFSVLPGFLDFLKLPL